MKPIVPSFADRVAMLAASELARERRVSEVSGLRPLPPQYCRACQDTWSEPGVTP